MLFLEQCDQVPLGPTYARELWKVHKTLKLLLFQIFYVIYYLFPFYSWLSFSSLLPLFLFICLVF